MVQAAGEVVVSGVDSHSHPLLKKKILIANAQTVWPPYSAFHLAEHVLPVADKVAHRNSHVPVFLDVGTGSGILPVMAKQYTGDAVVVATDLNPEATKLAEYNWKLNNLPPSDLTTMVADGMSEELCRMLAAQGGVDVMLANLPQQPLVNGSDLEDLRTQAAAAWNVDPSRDRDGLGIFIDVLSKAHKVMKKGGVALVSASPKQNRPRIEAFLNAQVNAENAQSWEMLSATRFDIPVSYDHHIVEHWSAMQAADGVERLFEGPTGVPQYDHYNIAIHY